MVYGVCELDVAEEVSATAAPGQIVPGETDAVTLVGTGNTVATTATRVAEEQPVVVLRAAAKYVVVVEIDGVVKLDVPVPPVSGEPPVAAAYQSMTVPAAGVALSTTVPVPHREAPAPVGTAGRANTFTVRVAVALVQPPVPVTVYVIVAEPAATPVIRPVELLTVATPVLPEVQAPPLFPLEVNDVVASIQTSCVPLRVPALGAAVTVTVRVAVALPVQGEVAVTVYVIIAVPAATPVMTPVELFTVATDVLLDDHAPPELPFEVKVLVPLTHMF
jgi:hypothetical protein